MAADVIRDRIAGWLEAWDRWPNPFSRYDLWDDVLAHMDKVAAGLPDGHADALAAWLAEESLPEDHQHVLETFIWRCHGRASMTAALVAQLRPDGPLSVVEALDMCAEPGVGRALLATIPVETAPDPLLIAVLSAAGMLTMRGDADAAAFLRAFDAAGRSDDVRHELAVARQRLR